MKHLDARLTRLEQQRPPEDVTVYVVHRMEVAQSHDLPAGADRFGPPELVRVVEQRQGHVIATRPPTASDRAVWQHGVAHA